MNKPKKEKLSPGPTVLKRYLHGAAWADGKAAATKRSSGSRAVRGKAKIKLLRPPPEGWNSSNT